MFSVKSAAWMGIVLGGVGAGIAALAWPHLPNTVPIHFDIHGVAKGSRRARWAP